jgi:hypothetical protein
MELDLLQRRADRAGYYVNAHLNWDPTRGTGSLYLQRKKKFRGDPNGESLLTFATEAEVHAKLAELERQT